MIGANIPSYNPLFDPSNFYHLTHGAAFERKRFLPGMTDLIVTTYLGSKSTLLPNMM